MAQYASQQDTWILQDTRLVAPIHCKVGLSALLRIFSALLYSIHFSTIISKLGNEFCYVLIGEMLLFKKENCSPLNEETNSVYT